jgi:diguanylate cyclase (GGDEF)-like protein
MKPGHHEKLNVSLLVVEDDPHYLYLIRRCLESSKRCAFEIDQASSVGEAFKKIRGKQYHLLLVEDHIDGRNGLELLKEMHEVKLNLPFVLMSNVRDDKTAREAAHQGVSQLIVKSESQFHDLAFVLEESMERYCREYPAFKALYMTKGVKVPKIIELDEGRRKEDGETITFPEERLIAPAHRDDMTGIYSHSYFHDRMATEFAAASRYDYPVSCIFVDIDNFKQVNEEFGFTVGDQILKDCANLLFESCRMTDVIARYGGEEFAILLPHTGYKGASELAARLQVMVAEYTFLPKEFQIHITLSMGVASFPEDYIEKRYEILTFAQQAAFRSALLGYNRITRYKDMAVDQENLPIFEISREKVLNFQRRIVQISDLARKSCMETSATLVAALDEKDKLTASHSTHTARYARLLAEHLQLPADQADIIQHAALLHDVGKLCIPDELLKKETALSFKEYEAMKQHPYMGYKILKPIKFLHEEAILVLHHHEWFNGKGYPCELKGEDIPLGSRIISVVDAYDTILMSGHHYRKKHSEEEAVSILINDSGTQFDPKIVKAFITVLQRNGYLKTKEDFTEKIEVKVKQSDQAA